MNEEDYTINAVDSERMLKIIYINNFIVAVSHIFITLPDGFN